MVLVSVERLDHFGIVSSVIKDLGIIESKTSGNPWQEVNSRISRHHCAGRDRARYCGNASYGFYPSRVGERCAHAFGCIGLKPRGKRPGGFGVRRYRLLPVLPSLGHD